MNFIIRNPDIFSNLMQLILVLKSQLDRVLYLPLVHQNVRALGRVPGPHPIIRVVGVLTSAETLRLDVFGVKFSDRAVVELEPLGRGVGVDVGLIPLRVDVGVVVAEFRAAHVNNNSRELVLVVLLLVDLVGAELLLLDVVSLGLFLLPEG